jgi:hypothetical protein
MCSDADLPIHEVAMKWGIERSPIVTKMAHIPGCGQLTNRLYDRYLRTKFEIDWHWRRNPSSHRRYLQSAPGLTALQQRIVGELNSRGVALCQLDELFKNSELWSRLNWFVNNFSSSERVQSSIREGQREFNKNQELKSGSHYILTYYDQSTKPLIDVGNPLLDLSLSPEIVDVVNAYLGMWSKLIYFDVWHTLPLNTERRVLSQRWHRDPEDRKKIRIFLYFNEVNSEAGAMEYFAGSQLGGPYQNLFPWSDPLSMPYPPEGELERQIPASNRVLLSGNAGTLVFCDTAGFHRGGIAKSKPRILTTAAYVTPASLHHRRFELGSDLRHTHMSPVTRFALV